MATQDVTLPASSCKDNSGSNQQKFPINRKLTILETVRESHPRFRGVGVHYIPVKLEPCAVLRGKWLAEAGFIIGQKINIQVKQQQLVITPSLGSEEPALEEILLEKQKPE